MPHQPDALMLFAAGFGTRMGALTRTRPKPLIEVAGRTLLDHALDLAQSAGIGRCVVNTHYLADHIAAHLAGRGVAISHEETILDTGGGLRAALPLLGDGPVFTLNTDAVWKGPNPLGHLAAAWDESAMDALLLCLPPAQAIGHAGKGDFMIGEGGRAARGPGLVYSGAQIIRPGALDDMPEGPFSLNLVWDRLIGRGRLHAIAYPGTWCDVGHPGGITLAEEMLGARDV
ncbi:nucleotidyltransferase family protein [Roseovarius aquimarinus]|uniref:Nucleotidyltransferase family protein n=1 Tax=Roseovarius aquimarinus TaxID=1229156 RepID=A0ABW7I8R6_9RHOB